MKPHINVGMIGHVDHGKTTLTTAICAAMAHKSAPTEAMVVPPSDGNQVMKIESIAAKEYQPDPVIAYQPRHRCPLAAAFVLPIMCGLAAMRFPGLSARNPSQQERNDPRREKTPQDLERMAAAQRKRDRKAARNGLTAPINPINEA